VIDKPPSAELRADQKDEDSLPPYEVLDAILDGLIDQEARSPSWSPKASTASGEKVEHLIFISEYKRFQSAPGPRLTKRAFWLDRRYPIANRWRDPFSARPRSAALAAQGRLLRRWTRGASDRDPESRAARRFRPEGPPARHRPLGRRGMAAGA
jgi:hypothetical protein